MTTGNYEVISDVRTPECSLRLLRLGPGLTVNLHYHRETTQIYFVLSGTTWVNVEGRGRVLKPNESLRIPPHTRHAVSSQEPALVLSISIPPLKPGDEYSA